MSSKRRVSAKISGRIVQRIARLTAVIAQSSVVPAKDQTRLKIERMEAEREERRRAMLEVRADCVYYSCPLPCRH